MSPTHQPVRDRMPTDGYRLRNGIREATWHDGNRYEGRERAKPKIRRAAAADVVETARARWGRGRARGRLGCVRAGNLPCRQPESMTALTGHGHPETLTFPFLQTRS